MSERYPGESNFYHENGTDTLETLFETVGVAARCAAETKGIDLESYSTYALGSLVEDRTIRKFRDGRVRAYEFNITTEEVHGRNPELRYEVVWGESDDEVELGSVSLLVRQNLRRLILQEVEERSDEEYNSEEFEATSEYTEILEDEVIVGPEAKLGYYAHHHYIYKYYVDVGTIEVASGVTYYINGYEVASIEHVPEVMVDTCGTDDTDEGDHVDNWLAGLAISYDSDIARIKDALHMLRLPGGESMTDNNEEGIE